MKFLGIDYGSKRVGIAVSDGEGKIAFPRTTLQNDEQLFKNIDRIIEEEKVGIVVLGDTKTFSGKENSVTAEAEKFAARIGQNPKIEIKKIWELWSSIEASRYAPGDQHDDAAAAALILQRFLDSQPPRIH